MLPHGGCRLTILPDGSGSIHYGAAPWHVRVTAHTFDFGPLLQHFQANVMFAKSLPERREEAASAVFPGSSEVKFVSNAPRVRALLQQGWASRLPPSSPAAFFEDESAHERVRRACNLG